MAAVEHDSRHRSRFAAMEFARRNFLVLLSIGIPKDSANSILRHDALAEAMLPSVSDGDGNPYKKREAAEQLPFVGSS
jgi:hypothetical protein